MRTTFVGFAAIAIVVSALFGSAAFNYAQVGARSVTMTIVQDNGAVVAIDLRDTVYDCYVDFDSTTGKIAVSFGTGCSGGSTGLNPTTKYHFHDILQITNKGQKNWQRLWVNSTDPLVQTNLTFSTDPTMTTGSTFAQSTEFGSTLAIGGTVYVGIYLDGSGKTKANSGWTADLTIDARASP